MKSSVTVLAIAYNHSGSIRRCMDAILAQKTEHPVNVIAVDDASTDGTAEILAEYAKSHANVEAVLRPQNLGPAKSIGMAYDLVDGDYFIVCEGDDYWTDDGKIELQADALDRHPECSVCSHRVRVCDATGETAMFQGPEPKAAETVYKFRKAPFGHTTGRMYRNFLKEMTEAERRFVWRDTFIHYCALDRGDMVWLNRTMSTYVLSGTGIWSSLTEEEQHKSNQLEAYQIDQFLGFRHTEYFRKRYLPERPGKVFSLALPFFGKRKLRFSLERIRPSGKKGGN